MPQVVDFVRNQPPEPRRALREALRQLACEKGDIKALEGSFENYYRLRVRGYRIIYAYKTSSHERNIVCLFAEKRNIVYEVFADLLKQMKS
ncbi:MAG: hypothetical protein V1746_05430 [bacterium]